MILMNLLMILMISLVLYCSAYDMYPPPHMTSKKPLHYYKLIHDIDDIIGVVLFYASLRIYGIIYCINTSTST